MDMVSGSLPLASDGHQLLGLGCGRPVVVTFAAGAIQLLGPDWRVLLDRIAERAAVAP